jgi:hypothetical protein
MEEIQNELKDIKRMLNDVNSQMQELREAIRGAPFPTQMLSVPKPYEHPWWQYQRSGPVLGRNYLWGNVQATTNSPNQTGSTVSGAAKAA